MSQERILIVDGDVSLTAMLKSRLQALGYLVETAVSGEIALHMLEGKWIDVIVLASVLQGTLNGLHVLKEIRTRRAFARIPMIVEARDSAERKICDELCVQSLCAKPYDIEALLAEIQDLASKKILLLSDDRTIAESIVSVISNYDIQPELIKRAEQFDEKTTMQRYCLIVMPCRIRRMHAEELIMHLRKSVKNRGIPVIVYTRKTKKDMNKDEVGAVHASKQRCEQLGACTFMDNGYSPKQFIPIFERYFTPL